MAFIHGLLLMLGDLLMKIPFAIWIFVFVFISICLIKTDSESISENTFSTFSIVYMLFYFLLVHKYGIASNFIGAFNLGVIIPIVSMLLIPYFAALLTIALLGIIKKIFN